MSQNSPDKSIMIAVILSFIVIGFMLLTTVVNNIQGDAIEEELESMGAAVYSNIEIDSPSIVFKVKEYIGFKLLFTELGPRVYRVTNAFYLFSDDYQIAYKFAIIPYHAINGIRGYGEVE